MIRWLFSTVSISMLWDDHDMADDWNISRSWVEEMGRSPGGTECASAGSSATGSPAPRQPLPAGVRRDELSRGCAARRRRRGLRDFIVKANDRSAAACAGATPATSAPPHDRPRNAHRAVIEEGERTSSTTTRGPGSPSAPGRATSTTCSTTSDPWLLCPTSQPRGLDEQVCAGPGASARPGEAREAAPGPRLRPLGRLRCVLPAPAGAARAAGAGEHGGAGLDRRPLGRRPPRLPGRGRLSPRRRQGAQRRLPGRVLPVPQCARHAGSGGMIGLALLAARPPAALTNRLGAARRRRYRHPWRLCEGPCFDNQVATLMLDGREASMKLEKVPRDPEGRDERASSASSSAVSPDRRRRSRRSGSRRSHAFDQEVWRRTGMLLCSRPNRAIKDSD